VKSYSADSISNLSSTQIQSIIDRFSTTLQSVNTPVQYDFTHWNTYGNGKSGQCDAGDKYFIMITWGGKALYS
jgi:hypothetical protein